VLRGRGRGGCPQGGLASAGGDSVGQVGTREEKDIADGLRAFMGAGCASVGDGVHVQREWWCVFLGRISSTTSCVYSGILGSEYRLGFSVRKHPAKLPATAIPSSPPTATSSARPPIEHYASEKCSG
jgi:hypothetical protein